MAGASSDGEMNYWPGFVDALANLVLALVFVVVIFTLALAVIASKVSSEVAAREVARVRAESISEERELEIKQEVEQMKAEIEQLKAELAQKDTQLNLKALSTQAAAPVGETKKAAISGSDIIFTYDPSVFALGQEALAELSKLMKAKAANPASKQFEVVAYPASGAYSAEKRSAYYRMVTLRNTLIERGVPADNITTKTATSAPLPGLQGQVRVSVVSK